MPNIRNWPLTWRVTDHLISHPELHNQEAYVNDCGTAGCFAGWAVALSGLSFMQNSTGKASDYVATPEGLVFVREVAVELLGIADDNWDSELRECAEELFAASNSMLDILRMLCEWAEEDGVQIPDRVTRVAEWMVENDTVELFDDLIDGQHVPLEGIPA